jgi:hypothetical protein
MPFTNIWLFLFLFVLICHFVHFGKKWNIEKKKNYICEGQRLKLFNKQFSYIYGQFQQNWIPIFPANIFFFKILKPVLYELVLVLRNFQELSGILPNIAGILKKY